MQDWRFVAFLASAGAAGIHFGTSPEHFNEYVPAGAFMLAAGFAQLAWAVWVARGARSPVLTAGAVMHLGIAAIWLASRTTGLPWGEMPFAPEHIEGPDVVATGLEVLAAVAALRTRTGEGPAPGNILRLAWAGALAACLIAAHDPAREQLAALATITTAFALRGYVAALAFVIEEGRHETVRSRRFARRFADARAGLDASG